MGRPPELSITQVIELCGGQQPVSGAPPFLLSPKYTGVDCVTVSCSSSYKESVRLFVHCERCKCYGEKWGGEWGSVVREALRDVWKHALQINT